ncbi:MAG: hypothetical protein JXN60_03510, partial [Lentisphaerae bacterium]|nr:hypothetical protein [Lentisphaerota bacterium]
RLWFARFASDISNNDDCFSLAPINELAGRLESGATVVTPDWNRLSNTLNTLKNNSFNLIQENRIPAAHTIGALSKKTDAAKILKQPLPIYIHPPVFVQPKFSLPSGQHFKTSDADLHQP